MVFKRWGKWIARATVAAVSIAGSASAFAQGCALCKNNASALKTGAIQALESGIFILLVPPVLIFIGIFVVAFRRRNSFNDAVLLNLNRGPEGSDRFAPLPPGESGHIEKLRIEIRYPPS